MGAPACVVDATSISRSRQRGRSRCHPAIATGVDDQKFGFSLASGAALAGVGRYCEAGDVLALDVSLPADVRPGDLLAVPVTGAYHHALSSNYNLVCRPPVVGVLGGVARPLVRRETEEDLLRRDLG
jgi:diaminopimelate decarboxylase